MLYEIVAPERRASESKGRGTSSRLAQVWLFTVVALPISDSLVDSFRLTGKVEPP
jgi:hypothetical protein